MDPLTLGAIIGGAKALEALGKEYEDRQKWRGKWRSLSSGMSPSGVSELIGAPKNVQVDEAVTLYKYSAGGRTLFINGQLTSWKEPKI